jgi:hypothetical protein
MLFDDAGLTSSTGNIPTNINAEALHSSFSPFGNIRDIQIPTDPQSRQLKLYFTNLITRSFYFPSLQPNPEY